MKSIILNFVLIGMYFLLYLENYSVYYLSIFGYTDGIYREMPTALLIVGAIISTSLLSFSNSFKDKATRIFIIIFYLFSINNFNVLSWVITDWTTFEWLRNVILLNFLFFTMLLVMKFKRLPLVLKNQIRLNVFSIKIILAILIICLIFVIGLKFDISLEESYIRRFASRENTPKLLKYLISNIISLILPIGFYLGFKKKDFILIALLVLLSLMLFSHEGAKSIFLKPLFVIFGFQIFKFLSTKKTLKHFLYFNLIIQIFIIIYSNIYESPIIDLLIHRTLFLPAKLATWHIDIYNSNGNLGNLTPAYYVGYNYLNNSLVNANSNFIVSLVARHGFLIAFVLIIPISRVVAYLTSQKRFNENLALITSILLALILSESEFQTTILNHGILLIAVYKLIFYEKLPKV